MAHAPLTWNGRLPGIAVRTASGAPEDSLRLDVTGFVGFAERGPLDTPVMIEDIGQYRAIFGGDVFLARHRGMPIYAQLPRAVQSFFENGGRRCYVVRVAGQDASSHRFRLSGLLAWSEQGGFRSVVCPAASPGTWSGSLRVATRLQRQPLFLERRWERDSLRLTVVPALESPAQAPGTPARLFVQLKARVPRPDTIRRGDLLRLQFDDPQQIQMLFPVEKAEQDGGAVAEYTATRTIRMRLVNDPQRTLILASRRTLPARARLTALEYRFEDDVSGVWWALPERAVREIQEPDAAQGRASFVIVLVQPHPPAHPPPDAPRPITAEIGPKAVRLIYGDDEEIVFEVARYGLESGTVVDRVTLESTVAVRERRSLEQVEILTEQGWSAEALPRPVSGLRHTPGAEQALYRLEIPATGNLPVPGDVLRLRLTSGQEWLMPVARVELEIRPDGLPVAVIEAAVLLEQIRPNDWDEAALAALERHLTGIELLHFDLTLREGRIAGEHWRGLSFNHLSDDPRPEEAYWNNVLAQETDDREFFTTAERLLGRSTRLHGIAEAAPSAETPLFFPLDMSDRPAFPLSAGPSTGSLLSPDRFQPPLVSEEPISDGLTRFRPISMLLDERFLVRDPATGKRAPLPPHDTFALANEMLYLRFPIEKPRKLHSLFAVDEIALIAVPDLGHRPWNCRRIEALPEPPGAERPLFAPCPPPHKRPRNPYARLRHLLAADEESAEIDLIQRLAALPEVDSGWEPCDSIDIVLFVHRAMINLAAARRDLVAILSLPGGFGPPDVEDWHQQLVEGTPGYPRRRGQPLDDEEWQDQGALPVETPSSWSLARVIEGGYDTAETLSYAAAFYGWAEVREEHTPQLRATRFVAPDGVVCGMIAVREIGRGPGVAPANEPLRGVVGLASPLDEASWEALYNRQVNVLHARPGKFITLSAYTLCPERRWLQISIRRMVILLRKLVYREGSRYVFESNNERFREAVQRRLERLFERLLAGGSVLAYEIDTGPGVNTPDEIDRGRFIIIIRVALSYPVEFITITLLRTGEMLLDVLEG